MITQARKLFSALRVTNPRLYQHQKAAGAKLVPFAGYQMPVHFKSLLVQHHACRKEAVVFDVSHMGQVRVRGQDRIRFLELATVSDLSRRKAGDSCLSLILDKEGGIIDDTIISVGQHFVHMVLNAGNKQADLVHLGNLLRDFKGDVSLEPLPTHCIIALQGPRSSEIAETLFSSGISKIGFMSHVHLQHKDFGQIMVCRCGYTGEDGYEISVADGKALELYETLVDKLKVQPAGLGARDSLRLEAGLCLHGHDISPATTPTEAALMWTVKKTGQYFGKQGHLARAKVAANKRMGFEVLGKSILREQAELKKDGQTVGKVTSGTFSPTLGKSVGMFYGPKDLKLGSELLFVQKGKEVMAKVVKMPFVEQRYYRGV